MQRMDHFPHTKQSLLVSASGTFLLSMTSAPNLTHFLAYWRMAGTLMEPVQLTQLKHWLKDSSCSSPSSRLELVQITLQWLGTVVPLLDCWLMMKKSQFMDTNSYDTSVPAFTLRIWLPSSRKKRSLVLTLTITTVSLILDSLQISSILLLAGSMNNSWQSLTWSPAQVFMQTMISLGQDLLRAMQASQASRSSSAILPYFSLPGQGLTEEKTELKVELMVAQMAILFCALSQPTIMVFSMLQIGLGTQRVLPRLAKICRSILVAMDWKPFLPNCTSHMTWVSIWLVSIALILMFLYWFLSMLGMMMRQMFWSSSRQRWISFSMLPTFGRPLISQVLKRKSTHRFLEVLVKVSIMGEKLVPLKWMMPSWMECLAEKIGLLKRLKKAYFPLSTDCFLPSSRFGALMCFALIFYIWRFSLMPIPSRSLISGQFLSLFISSPISLIFSWGGLMVISEIFFLLNSSKSSGMPVMSSSSGTRRMVSPFLLPSATTSGCLGLLMVMLYFFLQNSRRFMVSSGVVTLMVTMSSKRMSLILWQTVLPQLDMTVWLTNFSLMIILRSSFSLSLLVLTMWSMNSRTVWLRTTFLAASTLRKMPFSSSTKLDLNPLYMTRLSMGVLSFELKYLPVLPISTQLMLRMLFLRALFMKSRKSLGLLPRSKTFTCLIEMQQDSSRQSISLHLGSERVQMFLPEKTGLLMFWQIWGLSFSRSCLLRRVLSSGMNGVNLTLKMTILSIFLAQRQQWLETTLIFLKLEEWFPRLRLGSWQSPLCFASSLSSSILGFGLGGRRVFHPCALQFCPFGEQTADGHILMQGGQLGLYEGYIQDQ